MGYGCGSYRNWLTNHKMDQMTKLLHQSTRPLEGIRRLPSQVLGARYHQEEQELRSLFRHPRSSFHSEYRRHVARDPREYGLLPQR